MWYCSPWAEASLMNISYPLVDRDSEWRPAALGVDLVTSLLQALTLREKGAPWWGPLVLVLGRRLLLSK